MIDVGVMELNKNPENYFAEIKQSAFSPSNVVAGIGWSPDKMLQTRVFSYADAHRYRIGTHYEMLPVNRPRSAANSYHADGPMRFDAPAGSDAFYEPNSFEGPVQDEQYIGPPFPVDGDGYRYSHLEDSDDHCSQPRALFKLMSDDQKNQLFGNVAAAMDGVSRDIIDRQLALFAKVDPCLCRRRFKSAGVIRWKMRH